MNEPEHSRRRPPDSAANVERTLWIEDRGHCVVQVDSAFARSLDRLGEDILGRSMDQFLPPESTDEFEEVCDPAIETSPSPLPFDFLRPDGERVPCTVRISPLRDGDGEPLGFIATGSEELTTPSASFAQWISQSEDAP
ncbi:MAG TPA: PAS domain-containing protein [Gammaproteobacteria bacterium]|nr:PAS domain-containing protein [Gammaproteobacteria bacterium]